MSETKKSTPWWQTLPGILTGVAALVTALGGLFVSIYQSGIFDEQKQKSVVRTEISEPINYSLPEKDKSYEKQQDLKDNTNSEKNKSSQSRQIIKVGHLTFKILENELSPYAHDEKGEITKLSAKLKIRATDTMGISNYIDRQTVRLNVDGAEITAENSINVAVYERQIVEFDAIFIVPSDYSNMDLLLGRPDFSVVKIGLK